MCMSSYNFFDRFLFVVFLFAILSVIQSNNLTVTMDFHYCMLFFFIQRLGTVRVQQCVIQGLLSKETPSQYSNFFFVSPVAYFLCVLCCICIFEFGSNMRFRSFFFVFNVWRSIRLIID